MTKLFSLVMCVVAIFAVSAMGMAQGSKMSSTKMGSGHKMSTIYACPKCDMAAMKAIKCPMCGEKMTKANAKMVYACADCHTVSMKAGKCPKCHHPMEKMAMTYACEHCNVTSMKPGKCPKCGGKMAMHTLKMAKS